MMANVTLYILLQHVEIFNIHPKTIYR